MNKKVWYLSQLDLFAGLPSEKIKAIESEFEMKMYCKGHTIYNSEDSNRIYIVKSGKVELSTINADGQKFIIEIMKKGSVFGDLGIDTSVESYVETLDDSYICFLNKEKFFKIISREPEVSEKLLHNLFDRVIYTEKKAASFATDNVLKRFVKLALSLGHPNGHGPNMLITDRLTHEQLADMLGVSRQTITTMVNRLEREGQVRRHQKRLIFHRDKFEELAN